MLLGDCTKIRSLKVFDATHVEYDMIKPFAAFVNIVCFFHLKNWFKKCIVIQKWPDHPLLMTSVLVTIAIDSNKLVSDVS